MIQKRYLAISEDVEIRCSFLSTHRQGHSQMVCLLMSYGADPNIRDGEGMNIDIIDNNLDNY